jgi:hypothetical protein
MNTNTGACRTESRRILNGETHGHHNAECQPRPYELELTRAASDQVAVLRGIAVYLSQGFTSIECMATNLILNHGFNGYLFYGNREGIRHAASRLRSLADNLDCRRKYRLELVVLRRPDNT